MKKHIGLRGCIRFTKLTWLLNVLTFNDPKLYLKSVINHFFEVPSRRLVQVSDQRISGFLRGHISESSKNNILLVLDVAGLNLQKIVLILWHKRDHERHHMCRLA